MVSMCRFPCVAILVLLLTTASSCDQHSTPQTSDAIHRTDTPWIQDSVSAYASLTDADVADLETVIAEAQATAASARERFNEADPVERLSYIVLWNAPTGEGSLELVWVRPVRWSQFRIEGVLLSEPRQPLHSGRAAGELVSFPVDDLADWAILDVKRPGHTIEGAATLHAIEQRIGARRRE